MQPNSGMRPQFSILMYHSVSEEASPSFRPFAVVPEKFEQQIRFLSESGYRSWTVSGLLDAIRYDPDNARNAVVLTFDDGFGDFRSTALPVLAKYGVTATLYTVTGYVGATAVWLSACGESGRSLLGWEELRELSASGIEIGSHTVTHRALDRIPLKEAAYEIAASKNALEDMLRVEVRSFSYPFGYYNGAVRSLVEAACYDSACAVRYAVSSPMADTFALPRHIVRCGTSLAEFRGLLRGKAPPVTLMRDRMRSATWKFVRSTFYRAYQ